MSRSFAFAFFAGCLVAVGATVVLPRYAGVALGQSTPGTPPASPTQAAPGQPIPAASSVAVLTALSDRFEWVSQRVLPAVVSIEAVKTLPAANGKTRSADDSGSGVLIAAEGGRGAVVVTNNHVVANARPDQISINLADGRLLKPTAVQADPESDIAILRVESPTVLPVALLGDSDRVRVGQWVLALGSPFGLNQSVTHGIISARERGQVSLGSTIRIKDFLQTDTSINPGSSGGPLVNLDGEVIGINTAIASQSGSNSGVAFSIPVNLVKRVARQLQERGQVARGFLGLQLATAFEPTDAVRLGLDRARGAKIDTVYPETPAAQAGLRANDVVLQVDTVAIKNDTHLINLVSNVPAGTRVRMQVWRERQAMALDVVVGDWGKAQARFRPVQNP